MLTHTHKVQGEEMFSNRNGSFFFSLLKWLNMHCLTGVCKLQAAEQYQIKHVWIQRNQQLRSPYPSYNEIYHGHHFLLVTLHERRLSLSKKRRKKRPSRKKNLYMKHFDDLLLIRSRTRGTAIAHACKKCWGPK